MRPSLDAPTNPPYKNRRVAGRPAWPPGALTMLLLFLLSVGLLALFVQVCLPPPVWLQGAHLEITPLVMTCGALFLSPPGAWFLALFVGVARDLLSENQMGWGSVCLLAVVLLIQTQEIARWRHRWYAQVFFALVGTMVFLLLDYAGFCVQQHRPPPQILLAGPFHRMTILSLFNATMAPVLCGIVVIAIHLFPKPAPRQETPHAG